MYAMEFEPLQQSNNKSQGGQMSDWGRLLISF